MFEFSLLANKIASWNRSSGQWLDYQNALYMLLPLKIIQKQLLLQNEVACLLADESSYSHITCTDSAMVPNRFWLQFNVLVLVCRKTTDQAGYVEGSFPMGELTDNITVLSCGTNSLQESPNIVGSKPHPFLTHFIYLIPCLCYFYK